MGVWYIRIVHSAVVHCFWLLSFQVLGLSRKFKRRGKGRVVFELGLEHCPRVRQLQELLLMRLQLDVHAILVWVALGKKDMCLSSVAILASMIGHCNIRHRAFQASSSMGVWYIRIVHSAVVHCFGLLSFQVIGLFSKKTRVK